MMLSRSSSGRIGRLHTIQSYQGAAVRYQTIAPHQWRATYPVAPPRPSSHLHPPIRSLTLTSQWRSNSKPNSDTYTPTSTTPNDHSKVGANDSKALESSSSTTPAVVESKPAASWQEKRAALWQKAKAEARHYWLGTKLLWADIKIAVRLLRQIANGHEMTRRERKQLLRTSADLVRMVPFVVILIVPFAEFALPVLLKFFPNMLPSTYLDSTGAEAKLKKQLLVKMEMARFLQETTHLLAQQLAQKKNITNEEALGQAKKFRDFMEKVKNGEKVHNSDIVGFSKLFDSELTLENLTRDQLAAMCRLLDIKVFGSLWVLRYKLQEKLRQIQKDDALIQNEGVDSLTENELRVACRERGIYTGPEKDISYLKRKLSDWLELSLEHQVPVTLLLLSRAFSRQMTGTGHPDAAQSADSTGDHSELERDLATTLAYVPRVVIAEAEKEIVDLTQDAAAKLKSIEEEAVEAAYEEIQARKEGKDSQTRAAKVAQIKTAIGVNQEKLEKLAETNQNVEKLIDRTVESHDKEEETQSTVEPEPPVLAASEPITPAAASIVPTNVPAIAPVVPKEVKDKKDKKDTKKKTILAVDKLNDKVGAIIEEIKAQTKILDQLEKEKAELEASLEKSRAQENLLKEKPKDQ